MGLLSALLPQLRLMAPFSIANHPPNISSRPLTSCSYSQFKNREFGRFDMLPDLKVSSLSLRPLNIPLLSPFTIASRKLSSVQNVCVKVELADGSVGWGEIPTMQPVTAEDQSGAMFGASKAAHWLIQQEEKDWITLFKEMSNFIPGHEFAAVRAGIEMALLDSICRSIEIPLWKFFGGKDSILTTDITIPICSPSEAIELAALYKDLGFNTIKTKVGGTTLDDDISRLLAIREGHPECKLLLDANCGYNATDAMHVLKQLHRYNLDPILMEQPVHKDDWTGLSSVTEAAMSLYNVPVAVDESCRTVEDAQRVIKGGMAQVINIKLAKLGVLGALSVAQMAQENGIGLMIGGMVESRLGMGFAAHFAAGVGGFSFVDLDTALLMSEDPICGGCKVEGCEYHLNDDLGHGACMLYPV